MHPTDLKPITPIELINRHLALNLLIWPKHFPEAVRGDVAKRIYRRRWRMVPLRAMLRDSSFDEETRMHKN